MSAIIVVDAFWGDSGKGKISAELDALDPVYNLRQRTQVDFRCPIIMPEYIEREKYSDHLRYTVGSVASGTGVARAEFALRQAQQAQQAQQIPQLAAYTTDVARELNEACLRGETILIEGSQGTHLSLALTRDYP